MQISLRGSIAQNNAADSTRALKEESDAEDLNHGDSSGDNKKTTTGTKENVENDPDLEAKKSQEDGTLDISGEDKVESNMVEGGFDFEMKTNGTEGNSTSILDTDEIDDSVPLDEDEIYLETMIGNETGTFEQLSNETVAVELEDQDEVNILFDNKNNTESYSDSDLSYDTNSTDASIGELDESMFGNSNSTSEEPTDMDEDVALDISNATQTGNQTDFEEEEAIIDGADKKEMDENMLENSNSTSEEPTDMDEDVALDISNATQTGNQTEFEEEEAISDGADKKEMDENMFENSDISNATQTGNETSSEEEEAIIHGAEEEQMDENSEVSGDRDGSADASEDLGNAGADEGKTSEFEENGDIKLEYSEDSEEDIGNSAGTFDHPQNINNENDNDDEKFNSDSGDLKTLNGNIESVDKSIADEIRFNSKDEQIGVGITELENSEINKVTDSTGEDDSSSVLGGPIILGIFVILVLIVVRKRRSGSLYGRFGYQPVPRAMKTQ